MDAKKILIVDDEEDVLRVLEKRLTASGYLVLTANNGRKAVTLAKNERPALVLLDIVMPEMDGSEVAQVLKNDPATRDIPILHITCLLTGNEEKEMGNMIGGNFFVAKPFNFPGLLKEIEKHL